MKKEQLFEQEKQRLFSTGVKFLIFSIQNIKKGNLDRKMCIRDSGYLCIKNAGFDIRDAAKDLERRYLTYAGQK